MKKNLIKLLVATSLSNFAYAETTNNLVSTDFASGWTNTGNSYHGSSTIAGHHGGTVTSDSVSLADDVGLNKNEINQGFSVNSSANVWFWNNYDQSVTMTTQAIDDNGQTITQTRTLSGTCATWNGCDFGSMTDTMVFNSNTQADYNLSLGFSFSVTDPTYQSGHYAADLKDPSMTVTYTPVNIDSAVEAELFSINSEITNDLKDVDTFEFKNEDIKVDNFESFSEEPTFDDFKEDDFSMDTALVDNKEETLELEPKEESFDDQDSTFTETSDENTDALLSQAEDSQDPQEPQSVEEEPSSLQAEQSSSEESDTETETSTEKEETTQVASDNKNSVSSEKKLTSLEKSMEKIDQQVKDIGKNLQLKNLVKLKIMSNNDALQQYANIPFYKPKNIYKDQVDIRDNRVLYANSTLISYTQKDPIFTKEKELFNIKVQKEKLLQEIEVLKNGS